MATIHRSAKTGRLVTAKKAAKRPGTTVKETVTGYNRHRKAVLAFIRGLCREPGYIGVTANNLYRKIS